MNLLIIFVLLISSLQYKNDWSICIINKPEFYEIKNDTMSFVGNVGIKKNDTLAVYAKLYNDSTIFYYEILFKGYKKKTTYFCKTDAITIRKDIPFLPAEVKAKIIKE